MKFTTKQEIIEAAETNYKILLEFIHSMSTEEISTSFDFSMDKGKKEDHWKRDKNVRDVIMHLHDWHELTIQWINSNNQGVRKPFLLEGYTWRTHGLMNQYFFQTCQTVSLARSLELFTSSYNEIMNIIKNMDEFIIFQKSPYDWVGNGTLASYFICNTSSHYAWALKKLKAHRIHIKRKTKQLQK